MKIVKEFNDPEFLKVLYNWVSNDELLKEYFHWGLGDDGELYCRCSCFGKDRTWILPGGSRSNFGELINLRTMTRIVKQFGHLVIFT
jgi:hypothetical protein